LFIHHNNTKRFPKWTFDSDCSKHCEPVWSVRWVQDNLDGYQNFYSCSSDGRVTNWTMVRTTLWHTEACLLPFDRPLRNSEDLATSLVNGIRGVAFKPDDESLFVVGTEEGDLHLCSTEISSKFLMTYRAHVTPVNRIVWNPFYHALFLSCASEYKLQVWHKDLSSPVLSYSLGSQVNDVCWAPHSSTIFAAVTSDGFVSVYDISLNKYSQICRQRILPSTEGPLNQVAFSQTEPVLGVGDSRGRVHTFKLSPNLRIRSKECAQALEDEDRKCYLKLEIRKIRRILSQVVTLPDKVDDHVNLSRS